MQTQQQYTSQIEKAVASFTASLPGDRLAGLYDPIRYGMEAGGKRIRPLLTLMACEAFGADPMQAMPCAVGIEMFHNFTLLHDDVMDNSPVRRGRPSVMAKYGVNTAILSGDTMLSLATRLMMQAPDASLVAVLNCFNDTAIEVYEGQQLDIDFEHTMDVTLSQYLEMIRLKTSVLLGCAAKLGALVAGVSGGQADLIYQYAENLGLAFQIKDDLLDVYGDASFGKPIGGDILNKKKTYLLITALESDKREQVLSALNIQDPKQKIEAVTAVYNELGIRKICEKAMQLHTNEALKALDATIMPDEAKGSFRALAEKLLTRSK